ncbi:MAG: S-layer homology domain-containing protein, partial [Oscillospiraceae bacterium]|nr:S-layer homology domain-containing protein [Oscillospiraceae bacterium]
ATCTEDGYTGDEVCTVCGETVSTGEVIAATGHSYGEPAFTWAEDNSTCAAVFTCETCGDAQTVTCTVTSETTDATYAADGKTVYTAAVTFGDKTYTDTKTVTIPATGEHIWNDGVVTKEATCTEAGVKTYTCTVCGETKTEEIPATGHTVVTDAAVAATCTETGLTEGSHCSVCGEVIVAQETIAALGHTWNDGEVASDATATEDGEMIYTCTVCGETKTEAIPATGHTYGVPTFTWADDYSTCVAAFVCLDEGCGEVYEVTCIVTSETTDATCTEDGETVYTATCTFGDETYTGTQTVAIEAKGHTWNDGEVVSSATSTKDGEMTYTCTVCGETKTEVIPATGSSGGGSSSGGSSSSSSGGSSSSSGGSTTTGDTDTEDTATKHDCPSEPYTDVDTTLWYHEYIDYVIENELMIGISSDTFMPNIPTTRGMIVTILYRIENEPEVGGSSEFTDVADGEWYTNAIIWAEQNGIVLGYGNGEYGPNDDLNREQIAAILYRYAAYKEYDTTSGGMAIREFDDYEDISEYALEAMAWCINDGIIQGVGETTLVPQGDASRAQVAAILMRFLDLYT